MEDIVVIAVLLVILGAAIFFICREKKRGRKCIGCPGGGECTGNCAGCSGDRKN